MAKWPTGSHGGTYGGNPIGCAAALATIEVLTREGFMENVNERGEQLRQGLEALQAERRRHRRRARPRAHERGPVPRPARVAAISKYCLDEHHLLLMNAGTYGTTLRLMPPLVVTEAEVDTRARRHRRRGEGHPLMARPDPERLAVLRSVRLANAVAERRLEVALAEEHELPLAWFDVLAALQDTGGRLRINELAESVMTHKSSLSRQLTQLEKEGYVRRDRSDEDGRGVVVVLTPGGRAVWRQAAPTYRRVAHRAFCTHLTDTDVVALNRITSKVMLGE